MRIKPLVKELGKINILIVSVLMVMLFIGASKESHSSVAVKPIFDTTKPPQIKKHTVSLSKDQWVVVMNILAAANYYIGRSLTVDSADLYKKELLMVQQEFAGQLNPQIVADTAKKKEK